MRRLTRNAKHQWGMSEFIVDLRLRVRKASQSQGFSPTGHRVINYYLASVGT